MCLIGFSHRVKGERKPSISNCLDPIEQAQILL